MLPYYFNNFYLFQRQIRSVQVHLYILVYICTEFSLDLSAVAGVRHHIKQQLEKTQVNNRCRNMPHYKCVCVNVFLSRRHIWKGMKEIINKVMCQHSFPESANIHSLLITAFVLSSVSEQSEIVSFGQKGKGIKGF